MKKGLVLAIQSPDFSKETKKMISRVHLFALSTFVSLMMPLSAFPVETTIPHQFPAIEWNFQGKPIPETYWSPWLPLGSQQLWRFCFGFRFSSGTIAAKCPVKLTFSYDPANAKSGRDLPIKIKAELLPSDSKTFESAFGISLPNRIQLGFFGVTGLPDFLPWYDLPWDFWDIIGKFPIPDLAGVNIPETIAAAKSNIGVNTGSTEPLPLGSTESYHDERSLISVDLSDIAEEYKDKLAPEVYNKFRSLLTDDEVDELFTIIRLTKGMNNEQVTEFLTDLCGDAVEKLAGLASIELMGDPYFSVEGVRLVVNARCYIPNGKGSGTYPLFFTSSGQEQIINFRDITPFIDTGDKLVVVVDAITYEFRLRQGLVAKVKLSLIPIDLDSVEKVVSFTQAKREFTDAEFKLEIPLAKSDDLIQSYRVHPGYSSASVCWASPNVPLKGTVKAYEGQTLVDTVTESAFKNAHNVIVTNLKPKTTYKFTADCVSTTGLSVSSGEKTTTTLAECPVRYETDTAKIYNKDGTVTAEFKITNPLAQADFDYIDFSWNTSLPASTVILISPSSDLSVNYIACAKKEDGTITQGWVTQGGKMEIVTNHSIRVSGLEQGTTYYYNIRSTRYTNNDPCDNALESIGKVAQITTRFTPPPEVKVKVQFGTTPVPDIPVIVSKVGDASYRMVVNTDAIGLTPSITLAKNTSYTFSVKDHPWYQDATTPTLTVSSTAQGSFTDMVLTVKDKPSPGGYVYDTVGSPVNGATVKITGLTGFQTTTDKTGHYNFSGFTSTANYNVEVSKTDYVTKTVPCRVQQCGLIKMFSADNCILPNALAKINITVKKRNGTAINGATVAVNEGTTQRGQNLTTNAQGKAVFSYNFADNNANSHNLKIEVVPPTGTKIIPTNATVAIMGGQQQNVEISCPEDTQGPVISNLTVTQTAVRTIHVTFNTSEESVACVQFSLPPQTSLSQAKWTTAYSKSYAGDIQAGEAGVYRIIGRAKDRLGNQTDSNTVDFTYTVGQLCNPKLGTVTKNSATVAWNKYPYTSDFKSYQVMLYGGAPGTNFVTGTALADVPISAIATTTHTFTNLVPGTFYEIRIRVQTGVIGAFEKVSFTTPSAPPQITNISLNPAIAGLGQNIKIAANIADTDSTIRSVSVYAIGLDDKKIALSESGPIQYNFSKPMPIDRVIAINAAGEYKVYLVVKDETNLREEPLRLQVLNVEQPKLAFVKSPAASCIAGEDVTFVAGLSNAGKTSEELSCMVNWGDGITEKLEVGKAIVTTTTAKRPVGVVAAEKEGTGGIRAVHKYQNAGSFRIALSVSAAITEPQVVLTSEPLTADVNVAPYQLPVATFADNTKDVQANTRTLHIKATKGTYPITSWTLNSGFGSKQIQSGQGNVDTDVTFNYTIKGNYVAQFVVKDTRGTEVKKEVGIRIYNDAPGSVIGQTQGTTVLKPVQDVNKPLLTTKTTTVIKPVDLAVLGMEVPATVAAGKPITIVASVKDNNDIAVDGASVALYAGTRKISEQTVNLKAKQTQQVTFTYTSPSAVTLTLRVSIVCPRGFRDTNAKNNSATQKVQVTAAKE